MDPWSRAEDKEGNVTPDGKRGLAMEVSDI
jgi:hypothetical protein